MNNKTFLRLFMSVFMIYFDLVQASETSVKTLLKREKTPSMPF